MSVDKELLELAAKAEGHGVEFDEASGLFWYDNIYTGLLWNPLHNDGDALRLAVKLNLFRIELDCGYSSVTFNQRNGKPAFLQVAEQVFEKQDDDPYAATRRAIVRAAEIGKTL